MIYKKFELSLSLNGDKLIHIARSAAGNVIFREDSQEKLIETIDNSLKEKAIEEVKQKEVLNNTQEEITENNNEDKKEEQTVSDKPKEEVLMPASQKRITRGPDGKFISKSQLDQEEVKKKTFWDKLTS